jgi:uncharacterized protein
MPTPRQVIDSAAFARDRGRIDDRIAVADLPRLADVLAGDAGALAYSVRGAVGGNGELFLDLEIGGNLMLRCQRCLQPLPYELGVRGRFVLIEAGQAWPDDDLADDSCDAIAAERELDLVALMEQEALLGLPLAPRHERCTLPEPADTGGKVSPFAALASLKRGLH